VISDIYATFGSHDHRRRGAHAAFIADNPKGKHGVHDYTLKSSASTRPRSAETSRPTSSSSTAPDKCGDYEQLPALVVVARNGIRFETNALFGLAALGSLCAYVS